MTLKDYQFEMELDTIYELNRFEDLFNYLSPSLYVYGGSVNVYSSEIQPNTKDEMHLEHEDVTGHESFQTVPKYFYIEQSIPTVSKIIITGVKPERIS